MTMLLLVGSLLVTLCASASVPSSEILIDATVTCGTTRTVAKEGTFILIGTGNSSFADCSFIFTADDVQGCAPTALCYMFDVYAFFANPKASLSIESGTEVLKYDDSLKIPRGPVCTEHQKLTAVMTEEAGYEFDPLKPEEAYRFRLSVYNRCGSKGQVKNIEFEEAVKKVSGYHPKEEREEREHSTFVTGIVLGFGLACIFLVVLFAGYCYTRNSPNRPPGRSVGMPKVGGFKKKMKPNAPSGHKEVEMGVGYKAQDPDKGAAVPMLTGGASDPEKPPVDTVR